MRFFFKSVGVVAALLLFSTSWGQTENLDSHTKSIREEALRYAADQFSVVRPFNFEYTHTSPYDFKSKYKGESLPKGKVHDFNQLKTSMNFSVLKGKSWIVGATVGYRYTSLDATLYTPTHQALETGNKDFHYFSGAANVSYFSTLFDKRMIYTGSLVLDSSDEYFGRVKGLLTAIMILKADQKTVFSVGLAGNIDGSTSIPVFPFISYQRKLEKHWMVDITFPKSMYMRKQLFEKGRLSLGSELDVTNFYVGRLPLEGKNRQYEYRQVDVFTGVTYEHAIGDFVLKAHTGLKSTSSARLFDKKKSYNREIYKASPESSFFFNVGVSFNPFTAFKSK